MPNPIAPISEVYLKGETKPISPVLIATTLSKVATVTAAAANIINDQDAKLISAHSVPVSIKAAKAVMPNVADKATVTVGILLSSCRVDISRTVNNITAARAKSEYELKPASPGRMIINTPVKPTQIALHRRHPTG